MKVLGVVVARMGSTRVPGKSMISLCGKPVIWHIIQRVKAARSFSQVCLATSNLPIDDPLEEVAKECGVLCHRGDSERVLDRVYGAVKKFNADILVDVGGDCPFIHPDLLDRALDRFLELDCDYLCNYEPPTFPEGLDVNILKVGALEHAYQEAIAPSQRIHPFSYLTRHRDMFKIENFAMSPDMSRYHWSIDFPEDVAFVKAVYEKLYPLSGGFFGIEDILRLIESDEGIRKLNAAILKPKVLHAFWNSPGIMRDMETDLKFLVQTECNAREQGDGVLVAKCLSEVELIETELNRYRAHVKESKL